MGLFRWLKRKSADRVDSRIIEWRRAWTATVESETADADAPASLVARLDALGLPDDDIEIEREMLEALTELVRLRAAIQSDGLPILETGHRVIGTDRCHFIAPASMPDDAAQPSGRLLLTGSRAIFVGGARTTVLPWHAVGEALHNERDVVLIRKDRENLYRFRCNSFADAMCGAFLARRLAAPRPPTQTPRPQPRT